MRGVYILGIMSKCMWCFLWCLSVVSCTEDVMSCGGVKPIFQMKNISSDIPDKPVTEANLTICESGHSCCTREMEDNLRHLVRRDFQNLLHHNSRTLEGLLVSTASRLQEHVLRLTRSSENKTLALFLEQYPRLSSAVRQPVSVLYSDLLRYLDTSTSTTSDDQVNLLPPDLNLEDSVNTFFTSLFPEVYHHAVNPRLRGFSADYKSCLQATMSEIQPFGDVPRALSRAISRSAEAARTLFQALGLGAEVLSSTDSLLISDPGGADHCHEALLRMSYCSRCRGLTSRAKPCAGYCLNVMRGCLTQHAAELDLPWSGFVEATERLAAAVKGRDSGVAPLDVQWVLGELDSRVSEAIMLALENGPSLERKVKLTCGQARWMVDQQAQVEPVLSTSHQHTEMSTRDRVSDETKEGLNVHLHNFLASLTKSRGFYANLAESLCSDESFAETRDTADCWNGQRIGEYTKTVVAASVSAQKYNPELTWSQRTQDIRIAQLSDKLRHIRQVVLMQLTQAPESESYMRDEEGSGSGHPPVTQWADDEDQNSEWVDQGSGSGDDDTTDNPIVETPRHRSPSTEAKVPVEQSSTAVDSRRGLYAWTLVVLPLALSRVLWYG